jgi:transcriptional regulator with XRE-family HTH domain
MLFYGNLLKNLRQSKKLTLLQLAEKIGVSKQTAQKYETGKTNPRPARVYKIAEVLGISVVDISDLKPEKDFLKKDEILPDDDFFKILLKNWPRLTIEQRSKLAGESSALAEANSGVPSNSTTSETDKKRA